MDPFSRATSATEPPLVSKLHAVGRALGTPVSGTFELTSGCNFNCGMCYIHEKNIRPGSKEELTTDQWLNIGEQAAAAGTVFLLLTGGEPLVRKDFAKIYNGLKSMGLMLSVNTNGSLLTGKTAELLKSSPPLRLNVSLYAPSAEGYARHCGVPAFERVIANIRDMKDAGVQVKLNVTFARSNAAYIEQMAELVSALDLHCQTAFYMYPPVRRACGSGGTNRLSPEEAAKAQVLWARLRGRQPKLDELNRFMEEFRDRGCGGDAAPEEGVRCRAGNTAYWVTSRGEMLMCGMIPLTCGSVLNDGFDACWQKARELMKTIRMPAKCASCALRPVCSVCPATCFAETGDFKTAPPYLCDMSRAIIKELNGEDK